MKKYSLADKLQSQEYINNLSDRRRREILVCKEILSNEELEHESSIEVGYKKARKKFIDKYLGQINPELAERAKTEKIPVFNMINIIEEINNAYIN